MEDLEKYAKSNGISPRELDVIKCMLNRKISIKDIAKELNLSPSTVNNHLNNIFSKTKTSSKAELMVTLIHGLSEKIENLEVLKHTPKILIIDDEEQICKLLKNELEACGFEVYAESDSQKALDLVKILNLDFVVSDIKMPNIDGYELLSSIRKLHKYKPEILFMTGFSEFSQEYAYDLGAIALFNKPVKTTDIVNTIMEAFIEEASQKMKFSGGDREPEAIFSNVVQAKIETLGTGGMFLPVEDKRNTCL